MSDQLTTIITTLIAFASTVFTGVLAYFMAKLKSTIKVDAVKTIEKIDGLAIVTDQTHLLVNSAMSAQLKLTAIATRRIADLTKDKGDIESAKMAESLSIEHEKKQAVINGSMKEVK